MDIRWDSLGNIASWRLALTQKLQSGFDVGIGRVQFRRSLVRVQRIVDLIIARFVLK